MTYCGVLGLFVLVSLLVLLSPVLIRLLFFLGELLPFLAEDLADLSCSRVRKITQKGAVAAYRI